MMEISSFLMNNLLLILFSGVVLSVAAAPLETDLCQRLEKVKDLKELNAERQSVPADDRRFIAEQYVHFGQTNMKLSDLKSVCHQAPSSLKLAKTMAVLYKNLTESLQAIPGLIRQQFAVVGTSEEDILNHVNNFETAYNNAIGTKGKEYVMMSLASSLEIAVAKCKQRNISPFAPFAQQLAKLTEVVDNLRRAINPEQSSSDSSEYILSSKVKFIQVELDSYSKLHGFESNTYTTFNSSAMVVIELLASKPSLDADDKEKLESLVKSATGLYNYLNETYKMDLDRTEYSAIGIAIKTVEKLANSLKDSIHTLSLPERLQQAIRLRDDLKETMMENKMYDLYLYLGQLDKLTNEILRARKVGFQLYQQAQKWHNEFPSDLSGILENNKDMIKLESTLLSIIEEVKKIGISYASVKAEVEDMMNKITDVVTVNKDHHDAADPGVIAVEQAVVDIAKGVTPTEVNKALLIVGLTNLKTGKGKLKVPALLTDVIERFDVLIAAIPGTIPIS